MITVPRSCQDCCMGLSILGSVFMLYLTILFMADPERVHIIHHHNEKEDEKNQITAVLSGFVAMLIYMAIAIGLWYKNYGNKEKTQELLENIKSFFTAENRNENYEENHNLFEKNAEEMKEMKNTETLK